MRAALAIHEGQMRLYFCPEQKGAWHEKGLQKIPGYTGTNICRLYYSNEWQNGQGIKI